MGSAPVKSNQENSLEVEKKQKDGCWGIRGSGLGIGAKRGLRITKKDRPGESRREYKKRINGGWLKD